MIKIELSIEKREKIERLFLEDLVEGTPRDKRQGKRGRLIEDLKKQYTLFQNRPALCQYLYDNAGEPNIENVKSLLLADREHMGAFADQFQSYGTDEAKELLDKVFRYRNLSNRKVVSEILREMDFTVCPYCNRLYITVLKKGKVRPQLDHFFPKSRYPYLALCLYNLVPSCGVCNQAKSDMDTLQDPVLYPYEEEFGEEIVFTLDLTDESDFVRKMRGDSSQIRVRIHDLPASSDLREKVERQDKRLHLTDLYNEHGDYVADILKNYHINTEVRVEELLQCFPDIFSSREEIRSLMFMNNIDRTQWGRRPLAKLTHDICRELDSLIE